MFHYLCQQCGSRCTTTSSRTAHSRLCTEHEREQQRDQLDKLGRDLADAVEAEAMMREVEERAA